MGPNVPQNHGENSRFQIGASKEVDSNVEKPERPFVAESRKKDETTWLPS
jgi:hypothetical protein